MNTNVLEKLQTALQNVLFHGYYPDQSGKANYIVSLCNYYNSDNNNTEIDDELKKLNDQLLDYELLGKLTGVLRSISEKDFSWEPRFHREKMAQNISLSPTFNFGNIDASDIISEIENIRNSINNRSVNMNLLIAFIAKRAKESGDLNKDVEENK
jgi:uncharacterized protein YutD